MMRALSISLALGLLSFAAAAASPADRPTLIVVTQNHGVHRVATDADGEIYRVGVEVPYVHLAGRCAPVAPGRSESGRTCQTSENELFDGVVVDRTIDGRCTIHEHTVHTLPVAHDGAFATILPGVEDRTWGVPCDNGEAYQAFSPVTALANGN